MNPFNNKIYAVEFKQNAESAYKLLLYYERQFTDSLCGIQLCFVRWGTHLYPTNIGTH